MIKTKEKKVLWLLGAFGLWLLLSGCAVVRPVEDSTRFYVLDAGEYEPLEPEPRENAVVVGLARTRVARYLESPGIAVRERGYELKFSSRHRWAEPLESAIGRLVSENLTREGSVSHVVGRELQQRALPDFDLHLAVSRAEGVVPDAGPPHIVFRATWELRAGREAALVASGTVWEDNLRWDGQSYDQLAAGISEGTTAVSRQVAKALAEQL